MDQQTLSWKSNQEVFEEKIMFSPKVMLCACCDWANLGQTFTDALRSCGVEADMFIRVGHVFKYRRKGLKRENWEMAKMYRNYDIVQFMHSGVETFLQTFGHGKDFSCAPFPYALKSLEVAKKRKVKAIVVHGGSDYRQHSHVLNPELNKHMDAAIVQTADLLGLGAYHEYWVLAPVDTKVIRPTYRTPKKLRVAHYPSRASVKNTHLIIDTVKSMPDAFEIHHSTKTVTHTQNLERMRNCDIYIDHQGYTQQGRRYGEFGITAKEAAALGKIVITCTQNKLMYEKEYGPFVPYISNSPEQFRSILAELASMSREGINARKHEMRKWVEDCHSYKVCGERLLRIYTAVCRGEVHNGGRKN